MKAPKKEPTPKTQKRPFEKDDLQTSSNDQESTTPMIKENSYQSLSADESFASMMSKDRKTEFLALKEGVDPLDAYTFFISYDSDTGQKQIAWKRLDQTPKTITTPAPASKILRCSL